MSDRSLEQRYRDLVSAVHARGEHFRKPHGEWIRLRLDDTPDGPFLQLDSWNRQLTLKRGPGEHSYHGGFEPIHRCDEVLGINFGGFTLYVSPERLATYERLVAARPVREKVR